MTTATATRTAKKSQLYISETTTLHMNHVSATWNFLISSTRLMEKVKKKKTETYFLCLSLTLDTVLSDSTPENFANIWQIKWNWIWQSIKFETVRIFFFSDVFGLLSLRNFATMATWRNDFSSLLAWPQGLNPQPPSMISFGGEWQCS